ncbi:MAG: lysine-sensitive aspartokinase 3 [Pseudobdellovibrionaceae bacterium]
MAKKITVSKFGGTSMGDVTCMLRSAEVVVQKGSQMVVVSATSGTTNLLIELGQKSQKNDWPEIELVLNKIKDKHIKIAQELNIADESFQKLQVLFQEMESLARGIYFLKDCSIKALDTVVSLGERMSSVLFTEALQTVLTKNNKAEKSTWFDVLKVMKTDDQFGKAKPNTEKIRQACLQQLPQLGADNKVYVTQGYIGSTDDGQITTLGRGGSDYSAALLAEGVNADILEIWTDVPGIATTDPRLCSEAQSIDKISFREASELATFGAKVLHPATLLPAVRKNIPVFVGSSFDPQSRGTWISKEVDHYPLVRAMALRKNQILVTLTTPEMLHAHGFLFQIFKIFNDHKVSVDAITTSEISVSVTLDDSTLLNKKLISDLEQIAEVHVEDRLSLVSLIGNNINHTPGLAKTIFAAVADINVRMICLGASKHNFCFLTNDDKGPEAIKRLHSAFITQKDQKFA